ncbi:MAG: Sec-independent protein translocase protein TatB [Magnetospirillum sp.]|nr:Sec-independent protein translocase protein TatB [Magnetospirillum sp.]
MFDIGWDEMALIGVVSLIVIGPKDLPKVMRQVGRWTRKARELAAEFHRGVDEMMREAELKEMKEEVERAADPGSLKAKFEAALDADGGLADAVALPPEPLAETPAPPSPAAEAVPFEPPRRPPEP